MNRLTKKCLAASAMTHGLLLVLLIVGSAFVPAKQKNETPAFQLVPLDAKLIDEDLVGGGNPNAAPIQEPITAPLTAQPAAAQPEEAKPESKPEIKVEKPEVKQEVKVEKPEPKPEPVKPKSKPVEPVEKEPEPVKTANDRFKLDDRSKIKKIEKADAPEKPARGKKTTEFDLSKVVKKKIQGESSDSSNAEEVNASKAQARIAAQRSAAFARATEGIQSGVAGSTSIEVPGPGGPAYVGFGIYLKKIYESAWIQPTAARDNEPLVEVEVTVAKDGRVLSSRIIKRSGNSTLDRSVQDVLNRVKKVRPLPDGTTDEKREFRINFKLTSTNSA